MDLKDDARRKTSSGLNKCFKNTQLPYYTMKIEESLLIVLLVSFLSIVTSFSGDDRFIKKYAMMKVYESCLGPEVVKEVRKEMKLATAKCSGLMPGNSQTFVLPSNKVNIQPPQNNNIQFHGQQPNLNSHTSTSQQKVGQTTSHKQSPTISSDPIKSSAPTFDINKLQQAILEGYNKHISQQQTLASFTTGSASASAPSGAATAAALQTPMQFSSNAANNNNLLQQYRPQASAPIPQQYNLPQQNYNGIPGVYTPPNYPMFYPNTPYQQVPQQPQPYYPAPVTNSLYYQQPSYYPYYPASQRASRDLDIRGQLETLSAKMAGKVRNVTCVMQELGYLDENLEPAYDKMVQRINRLPVPEDLKKDMSDGVEFCRQFSMCVPDEGKDKLAREMVRPMFFFRCYKHKKLEACIMKDVRDRYSSAEEIGEDSIPSGVGAEMRSMKNKQKFMLSEDTMATAIYEFLYGGDSVDLDSL
ncbi:head involution defective [Lycorma delicatula]|uniref:head involution defective n=1 Tax=Lycorma delicatula TaxID=130591 RepID=UPI003F519857